MRNLRTVIDEMLEVIPETEESFRSALKSRQVSLLYTAPESIGLRWTETAVIVNEFLPYPPVTEWQQKCARRFVGDKP